MFFYSRPTLLWSLLAVSLFVSTVWTQNPPKPARETISISVKQGTELSFDLSPDGRTIVFDLLGQLWLVPARGGKARPITDAVRDVAEDLDPTFSPDGRSVLFRGERNGRTGLWLLDLGTGAIRQLTQLPDPDGFDGKAAWSPDSRSIVFLHAIPPDPVALKPGRLGLSVLDVASGSVREVVMSGIEAPKLDSPAWIANGSRIAFVVKKASGDKGGRVWTVASEGGPATPLTGESLKLHSPTFSGDGRHVAYFAPDANGKMQAWVHGLGPDQEKPKKLTDHVDVTTIRLRWDKKADQLIYSADGRMWKVSPTGGKPAEIPFTAALSITRDRTSLPQARFPEPGKQEAARGFTGLAISPDGQMIGMLSLGKLWLIPIGGSPRAVADVPFEASALAWSPDSTEVAWSAGVADKEDLFATNLSTGVTRQITSLPGREAYPAYSPDGRQIAFIHIKDDGILRTVDRLASNVSAIEQTHDLGSIGSNWTCMPQWSPASDGLLVCGGTSAKQLGRATYVPLSGPRREISRFLNAPIFLQWTSQNQIVFVRHDRLWNASFGLSGITADPKPINDHAALYLSSSRDGTLLYVSEGGLRLSKPDGSEQKIGWPVTFTPPVPETIMIRNVRIFEADRRGFSAPSDIHIEKGRIARIERTAGTVSTTAKQLDGAGRFVIPGLIDLHAHVYRPDLLPGWLYFGVTSIRDQGASIGPLAGYASNIASGAFPGPRIAYGGFQYYSDWAFDEEQGRGIEPEADPNHIKRALDLSEAFGAQHIKTRTFRRWDINARMITEAHRRGMRATGHCSHLLPLIAAGMDAKEHIGICEARGNAHMYDDMIQLFKAANVGVVPTVTYLDYAVRLSEKPAILDEDAELGPLMPSKDNFGWMLQMSPAMREDWAKEVRNAREGAARLFRAGVTIGVGTDIWQIPTGVHMELEQLIAAGLTPAEAIIAGTASAARIMGAEKDLGTIEVGKRADLVILDADPLVDIRNTRKIWNVFKDGQIIDRQSLIRHIRPR